MDINEINKLHHCDEVFWTDPDEGKCSRYYTINIITVKGNVVCILDVDGNYLECFVHELS